MKNLTEQEKADILQGLSASIHRLNNKIKNDERNGRADFDRVAWRKEKIERVKVLIEKFTIDGEEETINAIGEGRLQACS